MTCRIHMKLTASLLVQVKIWKEQQSPILPTHTARIEQQAVVSVPSALLRRWTIDSISRVRRLELEKGLIIVPVESWKLRITRRMYAYGQHLCNKVCAMLWLKSTLTARRRDASLFYLQSSWRFDRRLHATIYIYSESMWCISRVAK